MTMTPSTSPSNAESPLLIIGRWAWYTIPVALVLAGLSFWSASKAPSEESTRLLHEQHSLEWQYIRNITGK